MAVLLLVLTLMKGDKVIELGKILTDFLLLLNRRDLKALLQEISCNQIGHHCRCFGASNKEISHYSFVVDCVFPVKQIEIYLRAENIKNVGNYAVSDSVFDESTVCIVFAFVALKSYIPKKKDIISA